MAFLSSLDSILKKLKLLKKDTLDSCQIQCFPLKNEVIPCHPNGPAQQDYGFHEKLRI
jgi:hypothetical protein